jgi:hypothetical protein
MTTFNKIIDVMIVSILTGTAVYITSNAVLQYFYALLGLLTVAAIATAKNYK